MIFTFAYFKILFVPSDLFNCIKTLYCFTKSLYKVKRLSYIVILKKDEFFFSISYWLQIMNNQNLIPAISIKRVPIGYDYNVKIIK